VSSKTRETKVRWLAHVGVVVAFVSVGYLTDLAILHLEPPGEEALLRYVLTLLAPAALSTLVIAEVAVKWQLDNRYEVVQEAVHVRTFANALEFARFRRDVVMKIESLQDPIFCTSHCNLFKNVEANEDEKTTIKQINEEFFSQLAKLSMMSVRGGLHLLLQFNSEAEATEELGRRIDIFLDVGKEVHRNLGSYCFDVCQLLQESVKDYFIIENHVFKTIRSTKHAGGDTKYMYIRCDDVAIGYRTWLADLFENGDGSRNPTPFTERKQMQALFDRVKAQVDRERENLKAS
jgi:hypothetical protein